MQAERREYMSTLYVSVMCTYVFVCVSVCFFVSEYVFVSGWVLVSEHKKNLGL